MLRKLLQPRHDPQSLPSTNTDASAEPDADEEAEDTSPQSKDRPRSQLVTDDIRLNTNSVTTTEGYHGGVVYTERYADGSVYVGTFGKLGREGIGRLTYANGDFYEGQFRGDARHLHGRLTYAAGDSYEGEFCKDQLEGNGKFTSQEGWSYEGEFSNSMIHGQGMLAFARADFPSELLEADILCGPSKSVVAASRVAGNLQELLTLTQNSGRYHGEFRNGLRHGQGRVEFQVGGQVESPSCKKKRQASKRGGPHYLEGHWADGYRHGQGIVHIDGHLHYEGEFFADEAAGKGKLTRWFQGGDCDVFEGEFYGGAVHGVARYSGPDGSVYCGHFHEGLRQGEGELYVRETTYVGEFFKGMRHGIGRYKSPNVSYSGNYAEDERQGHGFLRERCSGNAECVYEGEFLASKRHGQGKLKSSNCSYTGAWHLNKRHGHGRQIWHSTNDCYEGQWQCDKMHGEGTLVTQSIKYTGQFIKGEQDGKGLQVWWKAGGDSYEGRFQASRPHGHGTFRFHSRTESYTGYLEKGAMAGEGTYTYSDGSVYQGQWIRGKQNGKGLLTYRDGSAYNGEFKDDAFSGKGAFVEANGCVYSGNFEGNLRSGEISVTHDDGQRELRRYDADGQEVERKMLPRVQVKESNALKLSVLGQKGPATHSSSISHHPSIMSQLKTGMLPAIVAKA
jgi:hypothetical protein